MVTFLESLVSGEIARDLPSLVEADVGTEVSMGAGFGVDFEPAFLLQLWDF